MIRRVTLTTSTELLNEIREWKKECNLHNFRISQSDLINILIMKGLNQIYGYEATVDKYQALHDLRIDYKTYKREYMEE